MISLDRAATATERTKQCSIAESQNICSNFVYRRTFVEYYYFYKYILRLDTSRWSVRGLLGCAFYTHETMVSGVGGTGVERLDALVLVLVSLTPRLNSQQKKIFASSLR